MTPREYGFRQPAEWAPHKAVWLAWPSHADLWLDALPDAQAEFIELCRIIYAEGKGELIRVLVPDAENAKLAETALAAFKPELHQIPFGDIWLRDTAPVFVANDKMKKGSPAAVVFGFNGWGGKYVLDHDDLVAHAIAKRFQLRFDLSGSPGVPVPANAVQPSRFVVEGGSIEVDGEGTCLTTRQCLLNPNRNPDMTQEAIEARLKSALNVDQFVWIDEGLVNDHTDGHIDTIARFVAPGVVVCMEPSGSDDPNHDVLNSIAKQLQSARDAKGRKLEVVRIPSPGRLEKDGKVMPASFVNFYIANGSVAVPTYGTKWDDEAVRRVGELFPGRKTVGASARAILEGGGAFHCITQQEPA